MFQGVQTTLIIALDNFQVSNVYSFCYYSRICWPLRPWYVPQSYGCEKKDLEIHVCRDEYVNDLDMTYKLDRSVRCEMTFVVMLWILFEPTYLK